MIVFSNISHIIKLIKLPKCQRYNSRGCWSSEISISSLKISNVFNSYNFDSDLCAAVIEYICNCNQDMKQHINASDSFEIEKES